jgi:hypothetical protein
LIARTGSAATFWAFAAGTHTHPWEAAMQQKLTLDLNEIVVETYETSQEMQVAPEHLTTCLETDCGNKRCCA